MDRDIDLFIQDFSKEMEEENAAIFAGAGLSIPAGYVNWNELLKPIADELGLDIERETDLVSLAQYYCNENLGNRNRINQLILNEFSRQTQVTENHRILARLPISTYWTTNYDKLIEKALEEEGKRPDVKYTNNQLAVTKSRRDAVVYKMHGDVEHPDKAIIIKDDYESYFMKMQPFITALSGDLVSKTFLFIGLSFTDPNLDYILSRIRSTYSNNQRRHYCLLRKIQKIKEEQECDYEYRLRKQELFINDLRRFNIKTILLDKYEQITEILSVIEYKLRRKSIFISGSACDYNKWDREKSQYFIHSLSRELINNGYNIVSGFGLGVGNYVISGALEEIFLRQRKINDNQLLLRPFPQDVVGQDIKELWKKYRQDMLSRTGISIFIFGNKEKEGIVVNADGVFAEFEIALQKGNVVIPVGATGYASLELWKKVKDNFERYYSKNGNEVVSTFDNLNNDSLTSEQLVKEIIKFIKIIN